jgi:hypothetical protein
MMRAAERGDCDDPSESFDWSMRNDPDPVSHMAPCRIYSYRHTFVQCLFLPESRAWRNTVPLTVSVTVAAEKQNVVLSLTDDKMPVRLASQ